MEDCRLSSFLESLLDYELVAVFYRVDPELFPDDEDPDAFFTEETASDLRSLCYFHAFAAYVSLYGPFNGSIRHFSSEVFNRLVVPINI